MVPAHTGLSEVTDPNKKITVVTLSGLALFFYSVKHNYR